MYTNENTSIADSSTAAQNGDGSVLPDDRVDQEARATPKRLAVLTAAALLFAGSIVFGAYYGTLSCGFLLDDFHHLGYSYAFTHGDPSGLLKTFTGSLSGQTDGLTSFRPGIALTFCLDMLLYGLNPVGYHATNLLMFTGCVFLCGVMSYQLTGDTTRWQRSFSALAAMLLFAVYPIHAESVSWIIGRVDVHCTFFYLAALALYIHFRTSASRASLGLSFFSFLAALICKEMAVTLPVVIALAEVLLAGPLGWKQLSNKQRLVLVGSYFVALAAFGVVRTLLLGTLIGGYGSSSPPGFLKSLKNFLDTATLNKILFGLNEELPFSPQIAQIGGYSLTALGCLFLTRLVQPLSRLRVMAFLILWLVVSVLPTFQIWHIFPNLVGSRLFFLGSAALCVLLAVSLVPAYRVAGRLKLVARVGQAGAVVALVVLSLTWFRALKHNQYPWFEAGRQMQALQAQLVEVAKTVPQGKSIVLIDLPQDFSGSGMIGRPEMLKTMFTRPLAAEDYAGRFVTLARPIPGAVEFCYPQLIATVCSDARSVRSLRWSKDAGGFVEWAIPGGAETLLASSFAKSPKIENPESETTRFLLKNINLNPMSAGILEVSVKDSSIPLDELAAKTLLVWRSTKQPSSWINYSEGPRAYVKDGNLVFVPGRWRSWSLNGQIKDIGIRFAPGRYQAEVASIRSVAGRELIPSLELQITPAAGTGLSDLVMPTVDTGGGITVKYDASTIKSATAVVLAVTNKDIACADIPSGWHIDDSQLLFKLRLETAAGSFELPQEVLKSPGKHQVQAIALDRNGKPVGYTSEPRTYFSR